MEINGHVDGVEVKVVVVVMEVGGGGDSDVRMMIVLADNDVVIMSCHVSFCDVYYVGDVGKKDNGFVRNIFWENVKVVESSEKKTGDVDSLNDHSDYLASFMVVHFARKRI